jgi:hypothetical protein
MGALTASESAQVTLQGTPRINSVTLSGSAHISAPGFLLVNGAVTMSGTSTFYANSGIDVAGAFTMNDTAAFSSSHSQKFRSTITLNNSATMYFGGGAHIDGLVTLNGSSSLGGKVWCAGNIDVNGTSAFQNIVGSFIAGNIDAEGGASVKMWDTHVNGNIVLAAGAGVCYMYGGELRGSLTDPSNRLLRDYGDEVPISRVLYVDGSRTDAYTQTGSAKRPYKTVQGAVDLAETMSPAYDSPVVIRIAPLEGGLVYAEDVVIKRDGLTLIGTGAGWGGHAGVRRIIITNATAASMTNFFGYSGWENDPEAAIAAVSFVQDSYEPWSTYLKDLNIGDLDASTPSALLALGVGDANDMFSYDLECHNVQIFGTSHYRIVNWVWFYGDSWFNDTVTTYNVGHMDSEGGGGLDLTADYDSTDDEPGTGNRGFDGDNTRFINMTFNGESKIGDAQSMDLKLNNLTLNETSQGTLINGHVTGNITVAGTAALDVRGTHIQGNVTLSSGATACYMYGGAIIGLLTDSSGRLTRDYGDVRYPEAVITGIDLKDGGTTNYSAALGGDGNKTFVPTTVIFTCRTASALSGDVQVRVGTSHGGTEVMGDTTLTALDTVDESYIVQLSGVKGPIANNATLYVQVTSADTGTSGTMDATIEGRER